MKSIRNITAQLAMPDGDIANHHLERLDLYSAANHKKKSPRRKAKGLFL